MWHRHKKQHPPGEDEDNRRKVFDEMRREMRRDRAKFTILPLSDFCLMQITRQRVRESVQISMSEVCPTCHGTGFVHSKATLLTEIERWLKRFRVESKELRLLLVVHPTMAAFLQDGAVSIVARLQLKYFVRIKIVPEVTMPIGEFRVLSRKRGNDITTSYK